LDVQMPEMDGLTLAYAIKGDPLLADTRLIVFTSFGQALSPAELKAAGIEAYLVKPVKQSRLFDCLANAMGRPLAQETVVKLADPGPAVIYEKQNRTFEGLRILLAEDNRINQQVALGHLSKLGYPADAVADGWEVLEALKLASYDIILMDCQMPEMDGYAATAEVRRREKSGRHVPIVAMTANALEGDRGRCIAAGMDDYLPKPVREAELETVMRRWLHDEESPIDPAAMANLRELDDGRDDLLREVIGLFLEETPPRLDTLAAAVGAGDTESLWRAAHALRSGAANLGATRVVRLCDMVEKRGRAGALEGVAELAAELRQAVDAALSALREIGGE
jgi:CheY-like chemotaxis protein